MGCVISLQGLCNFHESRWSHLLSGSGTSQRCFHLLLENIWCISTLARRQSGIEVVIAEGTTRGLKHSRKGGLERNPRNGISGTCLLLSLLDSGPSSSTAAGHQEGVTMTQGDGRVFHKNLLLCKHGQWPHAPSQLFNTLR